MSEKEALGTTDTFKASQLSFLLTSRTMRLLNEVISGAQPLRSSGAHSLTAQATLPQGRPVTPESIGDDPLGQLLIVGQYAKETLG